MSSEFEFVINAWSSLDTLTLVCDHWSVYQFWIEPLTTEFADASVEASYRSLKKKDLGHDYHMYGLQVLSPG